MRFFMIIMLTMTPYMAGAELYSWTDSKGVVNYTSDPRNLPEAVRKERGIEMPPKVEKRPSETRKSTHDNTMVLVNETIEKITALTHQIDSGITYADEYYEKNRPVSKYVLISYLNSMSYEIGNLKDIYRNSSLNEESKRSLLSQTAAFEKKQSRYNDIINDIDTIEVVLQKTDKQVDYKTRVQYDANYNQTSSTTIEENNVFTFSATASNTGSKADIAIELKGLNYQGTSVASHVIRTGVGNNESKEVGDRIILPRGISLDIFKWVVSDVKIVRNRK
jgi:hypothetical protein